MSAIPDVLRFLLRDEQHYLSRIEQLVKAGRLAVKIIDVPGTEFDAEAWRELADYKYNLDVSIRAADRALLEEMGAEPLFFGDPKKLTSREALIESHPSGKTDHKRLCAIASLYLVRMKKRPWLEPLYPCGLGCRADVCDDNAEVYFECGNTSVGKLISATEVGLRGVWMPYRMAGNCGILFEPVGGCHCFSMRDSGKPFDICVWRDCTVKIVSDERLCAEGLWRGSWRQIRIYEEIPCLENISRHLTEFDKRRIDDFAFARKRPHSMDDFYGADPGFPDALIGRRKADRRTKSNGRQP